MDAKNPGASLKIPVITVTVRRTTKYKTDENIQAFLFHTRWFIVGK